MTPWLLLCTSPPYEVSGSVGEGQLPPPQIARILRCCSFLPLLSGMVMTEFICLVPRLLLSIVLFLLCIFLLWLGVFKNSSEFVKSGVFVDHVLSFSSLSYRYCWCCFVSQQHASKSLPDFLGFVLKLQESWKPITEGEGAELGKGRRREGRG